MTTEAIERLFTRLREEGIDYLREMADRDPVEFLEVIGHVLDEAENAEPEQATVAQVTFVVRQQPGSDNKT